MSNSKKKTKFLYYPTLLDPELEKKLYIKQEFYETKNSPRPYEKNKTERLQLINGICNPDILQLQNHQIFLRNFISPQTPYNSVLIFHGLGTGKTCAAVTIAEGLKETVLKYEKKIYVISALNLQYNFQETLYNPGRESKSKFPGALQCTGSTYFVEPEPNETPEELQRRLKKIRRQQDKYYTYMGYQKFANFVRRIETQHDLGEYFSNAVFVIDEAHNLVSKSGTSQLAEESKKAREALKKIFEKAENNKFVLLSATPMINEINDLIVLINLLRANDKKKSDFTENDLGNPGQDGLLTAENLDVPAFKEFIRGYISYYRGGHPSSFPLRQDMTNYRGRKIAKDMYGLPLSINQTKIQEELYKRLTNLKLWVCEMSPFQWYNYYKSLLIYNKNDKKLRDRKTNKLVARYPNDSRDITKTQASNIIFPIKNDDQNGLVLTSEVNLNNVFLIKTERGMNKYSYRTSFEFLDLKYLSTYSAKFFELFLHIIENQGINFVYNYYVESGVVPICLILEQNGYVRYHSGLRLDQSGKYSNIKNYLNVNPRTRKYRCVCGKLDKDHPPVSQVKDLKNYKDLKKHRFLQGTYIRVDGQTKEFDVHGPILKSAENIHGEIIKVMVGGRKTSEGIDLKYVRSVHIINPWHNFNQIEQAIGRGIRFCSHSLLPIDEMSVKVYKYVTTPPMEQGISQKNKFAISNILENEVPDDLILSDPKLKPIIEKATKFDDWVGSDEHIYARALGKDYNIKYAERLMKESAIDCNFNIDANINWPLDNLKDNTRDCEYQSCEYKCDYRPQKEILSKRELNYDTYDLYFLIPKINEAEYQIGVLFSENFALTMEQIKEKLEDKGHEFEEDIIFLAMDNLLGSPSQNIPPKPILDKFDRYGYVVHTPPFFIFQPNEIKNKDIPLYYRQNPNEDVLKSEIDLHQTLFKPKKPTKKITLKKQSESYELGEGFLTSTTVQTPATSNKKLKKVDNQIEILRNEKDPIKFAMKFDEFNLDQHIYLLELTVNEWMSNKRGKPREYILRYYFENCILACTKMKYNSSSSTKTILTITEIPTTGQWVHNLAKPNTLNKFKLYNVSKKTWTSIDEGHPVMNEIIQARPKYLMPITSRNLPVTYYAYYDNMNKEKKYKFKIVNIIGQQKKTKKDTDQVSKKTLSTGKVCTTYKLDVIRDFYEQLTGKKDKPQVDQACKVIQEELRQRHKTDPNTIWFLGPQDYPRYTILQKLDGEVTLEFANQSLYFLYLYHNQN